jgi:transposase
MQIMTQDTTVVVGGVDAHAGTDHAAALDQRGALLCAKSFQTTAPGYRQLLDWLGGFGEIDAVAVESTGSYAAALVRYLREHDVRVVEVNQPHAHTRRMDHRGAAGFHGAVARYAQQPDRLDDPVGLLGDRLGLAGQQQPGGHLGIDFLTA